MKTHRDDTQQKGLTSIGRHARVISYTAGNNICAKASVFSVQYVSWILVSAAYGYTFSVCVLSESELEQNMRKETGNTADIVIVRMNKKV